MSKTAAAEVVDILEDFVNSYTPEIDAFIAAMENTHRTSQQSFTRLCLKWLEHCASLDYRTDGRNLASHRTSKTLIGLFKATTGGIDPSNYLPMI